MEVEKKKVPVPEIVKKNTEVKAIQEEEKKDVFIAKNIAKKEIPIA